MKNNSINCVLSVSQMYQADALSIAAGVSGITLMDAAGKSVADTLVLKYTNQPVLILCGPGNNGGDGFVAARYLEQYGWDVRLHCLVAIDDLKGDTAHHATMWVNEFKGETLDFDQINLNDNPIIIDAIFGAGLTRPIDGPVADLIKQINVLELDCISVDLPSGVSGDSGEILGTAFNAKYTVSFFCKKPGHLLHPGAGNCGELLITNIGIQNNVFDTIKPTTFYNTPKLWLKTYPIPTTTDHKYSRGHVSVYGGATMMGAARLAARAARRSGAGLSSILCSSKSFDVYASADPGTLVNVVDNLSDFVDLLTDPRRNVLVIGPGAGLTARTKEFTLASLQSGKAVVIDADALSVFASDPNELIQHLHPNCILTPHEGEFAKLFSVTGDKLNRTRYAAKSSNSVVLLKGHDTVIAAPDGRAVINTNAPPDLATAGAGDVLAGIVSGLRAQGTPAFEAACMGAWMHGECAQKIGAGLIAEDLCEILPDIIQNIRNPK